MLAPSSQTKAAQQQLRAAISAAKAGSKVAFTEVYTRYFSPVFRFLASRTPSREEAEDLAQAVFLKAWNALREDRVTEQVPLAYLYTLARNTLIDHWRKKRPEPLAEDAEGMLPDHRPLASENLMCMQDTEPVMVALRTLPPDQQQVIMHRFFDEMSASEIAAILGKSEVAIRQIQCRGLRALKKALAQQHIPIKT